MPSSMRPPPFYIRAGIQKRHLQYCTWHQQPLFYSPINTTTNYTNTIKRRLPLLDLLYRPQDISHQTIQNIYKDKCTPALQCLHNDVTDGYMLITNCIIAYSLPTNLCDILCPSNLVETEEINISKSTSPT